MVKSRPVSNDYKALVKKIQSELTELDFLIRSRTAETYWKIGKFVDEHLLANKDRADYAVRFFERLSKDVARDPDTLSRTVKFYRAYPISGHGLKLSWTHYRKLITVKDKEERKKIETQIIEKGWDVTRLQKYLNTKRELEAPIDIDKPIPQLSFTRGVEGVFEVVKDEEGNLVIDFGFRVTRKLPAQNGAKISVGDFVKVEGTQGAPPLAGPLIKVSVSKDDLYTYRAQVTKVVDGDTLIVKIKIDENVSIRQKLRLRGIDCPEMDTDEGKHSKKFVVECLKNCDSIVIKTYKDRTDKYDRYLADVFYNDGQYLNQELLNERLACEY